MSVREMTRDHVQVITDTLEVKGQLGQTSTYRFKLVHRKPFALPSYNLTDLTKDGRRHPHRRCSVSRLPVAQNRPDRAAQLTFGSASQKQGIPRTESRDRLPPEQERTESSSRRAEWETGRLFQRQVPPVTQLARMQTLHHHHASRAV